MPSRLQRFDRALPLMPSFAASCSPGISQTSFCSSSFDGNALGTCSPFAFASMPRRLASAAHPCEQVFWVLYFVL